MFQGEKKAPFSNSSCLKILTTPLQPHSSSCLYSPHICSAVPPQTISLIFVFRDGSIQKFVNTVDYVLLLPSSVPSRFSACGWDIFKVKFLKIVAHSFPPGLLSFPRMQITNHFGEPAWMYYLNALCCSSSFKVSNFPSPADLLFSLLAKKNYTLEIKGNSHSWFILIYLTTLSELKHIAIGLEGTLRGHIVHLCPKQWSAVQTSITPDRQFLTCSFQQPLADSITSPSNLFLVLLPPHLKIVDPNVSSESLFLQFKAIITCPLCHGCKEKVIVFMAPSSFPTNPLRPLSPG